MNEIRDFGDNYWQSILCMSTLLNVSYSGYAYFVTITTVVTHHRQTTIYLTNVKFTG